MNTGGFLYGGYTEMRANFQMRFDVYAYTCPACTAT